MTLNLILSPWLTVIRRNGERQLVAPWQITDGFDSNPIVDLDAPRPSLRSVQFQFLLAALQSFLLPPDGEDWKALYVRPPSMDTLKSAFELVAGFFNVGGDGPRFMQEPGLAADGQRRLVDALPIGSVSENAERLNQDLFTKRGWLQGVCLGCATTSILERQLNAGGDGPGYRTSVRGGGPLNTFMCPSFHKGGDQGNDSLWRFLWANVLYGEEWPAAMGGEPELFLPWVRSPRVGTDSNPVTPADEHAHALTALWGMPLRMLLDLDGMEEGTCDFCGKEHTPLVKSFWTTNRGENYEGWIHPHSPYYRKADVRGLLPTHARRQTVGYEGWPGLVFASSETGAPAQVVTAAEKSSPKGRLAEEEHWGIWVHGIEVDKAKVIGFWSSHAPLIFPPEGVPALAIRDQATMMVNGASSGRLCLTSALKMAWFSEHQAQAVKKMEFPGVAFIEATEAHFFRLLQRFADGLAGADESGVAELRDVVGLEWANVIYAEAQRVFEAWAEQGQDGYDPRRSAEARRFLSTALHGKKFYGVLGVRDREKPADKKPKVRA